MPRWLNYWVLSNFWDTSNSYHPQTFPEHWNIILWDYHDFNNQSEGHDEKKCKQMSSMNIAKNILNKILVDLIQQ